MISRLIESLLDVQVLQPHPGDGSPEISWEDRFLYYAPGPTTGWQSAGQPFATIVTKDYPGEPVSGLGDGVFRVNVDAGQRSQPECADPTARDVVMPHPVYGALGWVCVVQPGTGSRQQLLALVGLAHRAAANRWRRRHGDG